MPVVDFKRNLNLKDINRESKNKKLILNFNLSEEAGKTSLTLNSILHQNNTLKNSNKIHKSQENILKDKRKLKLKDLKSHSQISKRKEMNSLKKDSIMTISTKITLFLTELFQIFKTEANLPMIQRKKELWSCK